MEVKELHIETKETNGLRSPIVPIKTSTLMVGNLVTESILHLNKEPYSDPENMLALQMIETCS